jgi:hypothetical protein
MFSHHSNSSASTAHTGANPRRCAAQDSVSVPLKRQKLDHPSDDSGSITGVISAPQPTQQASLQKTNSQESEGVLSASKWFDNANSNLDCGLQNMSNYGGTENIQILKRLLLTGLLDEPPFFITQSIESSSFDHPIRHGLPDSQHFGGYTQHDSEKEDLRDVIDDLTIENKRLRQQLRSRKRQQDSQNPNRLFEVRVHGLPSDKKRELEALLRNFTSKLNVTAEPPSGTLRGTVSGVQGPKVGMLYSTGTTKRVQTDSGYVSNSNSGQASASPSNPGRPTTSNPKKSNEKTVKSYLHSIPNAPPPRQRPAMSERARMSLVVRRLENLFTGENATPGDHSQPLQQQEVSRLAANADKQRGNKRHRHEGSREAHILPFDSEINIERLDSMESSANDNKSRDAAYTEASGESTPEGINSTSSGTRSPDQRPTRPLDLDIHRAQVAEENIEYLRHLGLTFPKLNPTANSEGEGWIYLNLLISMAQLHTINVTPAFIKKSIKKLSSKFELSKDGNQVRWIGGNRATNVRSVPRHNFDLMGENSANEVAGIGVNHNDKESKRIAALNVQMSTVPFEGKSSNQINSQVSKRQHPFPTRPTFPTCIPKSRSQPASSFDYKPILFTGKPLSHQNLSYLNECTGAQSNLDNPSTSKSNNTSDDAIARTDAGPIVFYSSTLFCSDFSGDRAPTNMKRPNPEVSNLTLGVSAATDPDETRDRDACYFTKSTLVPIPDQSYDAIALDLPPIIESRDAEQEVRNLPASGIGGVTPQDNFVIYVKIARTRLEAHEEAKVGCGKGGVQRFHYRICGFSKTELPPSQLPPPSYIFLPFMSSTFSGLEGAWESSDDGVDTSIDRHEPVPPIFLTHFSTEESSPLHALDDMDGDSSIDMLATARGVDASVVAALEREFKLNRKPTPKGEEVAVGSLAATAGDESETDSGVESDVDEVGSYMDSDDDF